MTDAEYTGPLSFAVPASADLDAAAAEIHTVSAPSAASTSSMLDQLTQLGQRRDAGAPAPEEFETQKQRILAGS